VVTNAKFADRFRQFAGSRQGPFELTVVDDGTMSDEDKLGAIGDLALVIRQQGIDDDLLVAAGDSIFGDGDLEAVRRYSAITTDADGRIAAFEEKPEKPETTLAGIALYYYPRSALPLIDRYLAEGNNPDQPGRLVEWMYQRRPFYVWQVPGRWYDIGSPETLEQADREFSQS
jgi:glucose-1-phosphate thymidylyltransferase